MYRLPQRFSTSLPRVFLKASMLNYFLFIYYSFRATDLLSLRSSNEDIITAERTIATRCEFPVLNHIYHNLRRVAEFSQLLYVCREMKKVENRWSTVIHVHVSSIKKLFEHWKMSLLSPARNLILTWNDDHFRHSVNLKWETFIRHNEYLCFQLPSYQGMEAKRFGCRIVRVTFSDAKRAELITFRVCGR